MLNHNSSGDSRATGNRRLEAQQQPVWVVLLMIAFLVAGVIGLPVVQGRLQPAGAHVYPRGAPKFFPYNGLLWASARKNYNAIIHVTSNSCVDSSTYPRSVESSVYPAIKSSSIGSKWAYGFRYIVKPCGFTASGGLGTNQQATGSYSSNNYDTAVYYDPNQENFRQPNGGYIGGRVRRQMATLEYCKYYGVAHPCGTRDWIQINKTKWGSRSPTYRFRHLLHENGHVNGLADSCETYTIMRPGGEVEGDPCSFHTFDGWQDHDRNDIWSVYLRS
jgi:hypothetical protein